VAARARRGLIFRDSRLHADRASGQCAADRRQAKIGAELLERLRFFQLQPRVILDLGCGTGTAAVALRARFPRAHVLALDLAFGMAIAARRRQRFWRRFSCVCADARALPLAAQSVDLVFSNMMLHYCEDPQPMFAEIQRVLRAGGLLLFSSFGPDTLRELQLARTNAGPGAVLRACADMAQLGAAMAHAGLAEPVMDRELEISHSADARALLQELRAIRARRAGAQHRQSSTGRQPTRTILAGYESMRTAAGLPASWEVIYGAAFAGPGAGSTTQETIVALSTIGTRTRGP